MKDYFEGRRVGEKDIGKNEIRQEFEAFFCRDCLSNCLRDL
jgi:hypothetical protein